MQPTILKYMDHSDLLVDTATIITINPWSDDRPAIVLNQTIFYPQGGGQPTIKGSLPTIMERSRSKK